MSEDTRTSRSWTDTWAVVCERQLIAFDKSSRSVPSTLRQIVSQLQGRLAVFDIDVEDIVILLAIVGLLR